MECLVYLWKRLQKAVEKYGTVEGGSCRGLIEVSTVVLVYDILWHYMQELVCW